VPINHHSPKQEQEDESAISRGSVFATTRWTVVLNANGDSEEGREALETLCRIYWFPVYALVRRRGFDPETARDFTQSFFVHLLSKNALSKVRRERGRFRRISHNRSGIFLQMNGTRSGLKNAAVAMLFWSLIRIARRDVIWKLQQT
jgi:hypothetical protein